MLDLRHPLMRILKGGELWPRVCAGLPAEPKICWYPSAGGDFRDMLFLNERNPGGFDIRSFPDLFIHTDYAANALKPGEWIGEKCAMPFLPPAGLELYSDGRRSVRVEEIERLVVSSTVRYEVDEKFCDFHGASRACVDCFELSVSSGALGTFRRPLLYFYFENVNFFEEVVLRRGLRVSHLVKVCEGCGMGGSRQSISFVYGFLGLMGTEVLAVDAEVHSGPEFVATRPALREGFDRRDNPAVRLTRIGRVPQWGGSSVRIFRVEPDAEADRGVAFRENLATISKGWMCHRDGHP